LKPNLLIIGRDYHPGFQQIAFADTDRGELGERRPLHREEAEPFSIASWPLADSRRSELLSVVRLKHGANRQPYPSHSRFPSRERKERRER